MDRLHLDRLHLDRLHLAALIAVAYVGAAAAAQAGPCTAQIELVEGQIHKAEAGSSPGGAGTPSARQSIGAQLHHQPTPGSVESAQNRAAAAAEAALERARAADATGDANACAQALADAKELYGLR